MPISTVQFKKNSIINKYVPYERLFDILRIFYLNFEKIKGGSHKTCTKWSQMYPLRILYAANAKRKVDISETFWIWPIFTCWFFCNSVVTSKMYSSRASGIVKASPSTMQYNENSSISMGSSTLMRAHISAMMSSTTVVDFVLMTVSLPPGNLYIWRLELRPALTAVTSSTLGTFLRPPYRRVLRKFCRQTLAVPEN